MIQIDDIHSFTLILSDLIFYSDALALKKTDLSKLFSRNAGSRTSHMDKYTPKHHINVRSASYDVKGMMTFFNSIFGEFYKKIGLDLAEIETMAAYFTGEVAGGVSFGDTAMDVEMIAVLNKKNKPARKFLESVYLPWIMDYGRKMAVFYSRGDIASAALPEYRDLFSSILERILCEIKK